jgi:hypothetical protein
MAKGNTRLTNDLDKLLDDLKKGHSKRMNAILNAMEDEEFASAYLKLMEYTAPKLQRRELITDADNTLDVNLNVVYSQSEVKDE